VTEQLKAESERLRAAVARVAEVRDQWRKQVATADQHRIPAIDLNRAVNLLNHALGEEQAIACGGCQRHYGWALHSGIESLAQTARSEGWFVSAYRDRTALCPDCDGENE